MAAHVHAPGTGRTRAPADAFRRGLHNRPSVPRRSGGASTIVQSGTGFMAFAPIRFTDEQHIVRDLLR